MNNLKTLQEICKVLGVTRRAVQGYEAAGLVTATTRNKYGYLLYGEVEQKRIGKIKLYQQFGFKIKEIKYLIDAPNHIAKEALERQVEKLKEEHKQIDMLIVKAEALIEELSK